MGWKAKISLNKGLLDTFSWYLNNKVFFNSVSKKAWMEWLQLQTMLINEKQLNLAEKEARDYLNDQLDKFLNNGDVDRPVGFKPVE